MKALLLISLPLLVLDQLTKALVLARVPFGVEIPVVVGFFSLVHFHNTGAAFSMLTGKNEFFLALAGVALVVITVLACRGAFRDRLSKGAAALLAAGVAGNLIDRILHGHVIDFLLFYLPLYGPWPAFNVADSCICVAAGMFLVSAFLDGKSTRTPA